MRRVLIPVLVAAMILFAAACGGSDQGRTEAEASDGLRIAAFDFAENELLAEMYAQAAESVGIPVVRLGPVGPREVVDPALASGLVDLVLEYAGTALRFAGGGQDSLGVDDTVGELNDRLRERGLIALEPASASDSNVFVVTAETADTLGLTVVSDLAKADLHRLGGPAECPNRPLCALGLSETYGVTFEFVPQPSIAFTAESLRRGEIDVGVLFSTSPELASVDLVPLGDDRNLQPPENVIPVLRQEAVDSWGPELVSVLNRVSAAVTTPAVRSMNLRVQQGEPIADVAAQWLGTQGLLN